MPRIDFARENAERMLFGVTPDRVFSDNQKCRQHITFIFRFIYLGWFPGIKRTLCMHAFTFVNASVLKIRNRILVIDSVDAFIFFCIFVLFLAIKSFSKLFVDPGKAANTLNNNETHNIVITNTINIFLHTHIYIPII